MPWQCIEKDPALYRGYASQPSMDLEFYLGYILLCWVSFLGEHYIEDNNGGARRTTSLDDESI